MRNHATVALLLFVMAATIALADKPKLMKGPADILRAMPRDVQPPAAGGLTALHLKVINGWLAKEIVTQQVELKGTIQEIQARETKDEKTGEAITQYILRLSAYYPKGAVVRAGRFNVRGGIASGTMAVATEKQLGKMKVGDECIVIGTIEKCDLNIQNEPDNSGYRKVEVTLGLSGIFLK